MSGPRPSVAPPTPGKRGHPGGGKPAQGRVQVPGSDPRNLRRTAGSALRSTRTLRARLAGKPGSGPAASPALGRDRLRAAAARPQGAEVSQDRGTARGLTPVRCPRPRRSRRNCPAFSPVRACQRPGPGRQASRSGPRAGDVVRDRVARVSLSRERPRSPSRTAREARSPRPATDGAHHREHP